MTKPDRFTAIQLIADLDIRDANSDDPEGIILAALSKARSDALEEAEAEFRAQNISGLQRICETLRALRDKP